MADINITESLDDRDVVAAFARQLKLMERMEKQVTALSKESQKSNDTILGGLKKMGAETVRWATGVFSVGHAYELITSSAREARQETERISRELEGAFRKFNTLNNLKGLESQQAQEGIAKNAVEHGFTIQQSAAAATALSSAGFSWKEAAGPAGNALLKGMTAAGEWDANPEAFAAPLTGYLEAIGKEKTGENLTSVLQRVVSLADTNFQMSNVPDIAKEAGALGALSTEEQFGAMATLQKTMPGPEAATSLRAITLALTAKKGNKKAMRALAKMGINPEEIDLVGEGEDLASSLDRVQQGLMTVPKEDRPSLMSQFVGTEHQAAFIGLMEKTKSLREFINVQKDPSKYQEIYEKSASGRGPADKRITAQLEMQSYAGDTEQDDLFLKQRRLMKRQEGASNARIKLFEMAYDTQRYLGASQGFATGLTEALMGEKSTYVDIKAALDANTKATKEATDVEKQRLAKPTPQQVTPPVLNSGKPTR